MCMGIRSRNMNIEVGTTAWVGVARGVVLATVVEIESEKQEQIRLQDKTGHILIRHVCDLHATEAQALRARLDQEKFWAARYREMAYACDENVERIGSRITRIETRRKVVA